MNEFREKVADLAHRQWSGWMIWLYSKCNHSSDGGLEIPVEWVQHWQRQMETDYADLPERDKISDRKEADKFIALFERELEAGLVDAVEDVLDEMIEASVSKHDCDA